MKAVQKAETKKKSNLPKNANTMGVYAGWF